ncbi:hypothetical protein GCM10009661_18570 [Catellatospora chokoriensis]|uniref:Uncharacterized protein n=1 Tax=Catellatospora chokoriensis TaxID=310353 RepID=A0A8J3JWZ8_9ACTN|nr:hypothetical protein Cch02nite_61160 [Catellatospora chokoriensis]
MQACEDGCHRVTEFRGAATLRALGMGALEVDLLGAAAPRPHLLHDAHTNYYSASGPTCANDYSVSCTTSRRFVGERLMSAE